MTLDPEQTRLLKAVLRKRPRAELKQLFTLVRTHDDRSLLAALAPPKAKRRSGDRLAREVESALKPIMAPAAEKADMLMDFMAKKHRRKLEGEAKGLADAIRRLRARFTDAQIRDGAEGLSRNLRKLYGDQESVI